MSNAQIIDMSRLPAPAVVQVPEFETILAALRTDLLAAMPADLQAATADTMALESEPLTVWLQRLAYQLVIERSNRNDSAHAVMLAYARGSDLDQLGAFFGVVRHVLVPANPQALPPVPAVLESDDAFRERIQMAPRGYSVAGPVGAYVFHARNAHGDVLDAAASSPSPGDVVVSILAREGDGTPTNTLLQTVAAALNADDVRPLTDHVTVQAAGIVTYTIHAIIYPFPGPDSSSVLQTVQERIHTYAKAMHRIGSSPTLSGIYAALHIDGVQRVELTQPTQDIPIGPNQASYCTAINVTAGAAHA